jgi:hypothetical protein
MSTFTRLSAAAASIIVISVILGFELGAAALYHHNVENVEISRGPDVISPGSASEKNIKTRSIAGFQAAALSFSSFTSTAYPAANPVGPAAGNIRVAMPKKMRSIPSSCLMAMN